MSEQSGRLWARIRSSEDLGRFLAEVRVERDLTQQELASQLGIQRPYLSSLESGESTLHVERLFALLGALGVELTVRALPVEPPERGGDLSFQSWDRAARRLSELDASHVQREQKHDHHDEEQQPQEQHHKQQKRRTQRPGEPS